MTDPQLTEMDVEEQRRWIIDHREQLQLSWSELAKRTGIAQGTLSQFGSERGYGGDEKKLAEKVYRSRRLLASQASIEAEAPEVPDYYETVTSRQLESLLSWGQRGRIVVAAMGPGLGKTTTASRYRLAYPNVFLASMAPSTAGVNNMQIEVLEALGERDAAGTPQRLSKRIRERLTNFEKPLIIIDEAQHLSEKAVEEIRSWHDGTRCGIALLGNESVLLRLEGGSRRAAFAQIYSRVSMKVVRSLPLHGDIEAMAAAWGIGDGEQIAYLRKICMLPGGLRSGTMVLELATMLASAENKRLDLASLQDAWAQLSARSVL